MLPTYEQAADECRSSEKPSALSWFITEQEPGNIVEEAKFRRELEAVIKETETAAALRQQAFCERKASQEFDAREEELLNEIERLQSKEADAIPLKLEIAFGIGAGFLTFLLLNLILWLSIA